MRNKRHRFEIVFGVLVGLLYAVAQRFFDRAMNDFFAWDLAPFALIASFLAFLAAYWSFIEPRLGPSEDELREALDKMVDHRYLTDGADFQLKPAHGLSNEQVLLQHAPESFRDEWYARLGLKKPKPRADRVR